MKISSRVVYGAMAAIVLLAGGCSAGTATSGGASATATTSTTGPVATPGATAAVTITIKDFGYQGPPSVAPGATITVTNMDNQSHTVTSDDGSSFDAVAKGQGGTATFQAPTKPGTYAYHCSYHGNMHGTLVVK